MKIGATQTKGTIISTSSIFIYSFPSNIPIPFTTKIIPVKKKRVYIGVNIIIDDKFFEKSISKSFITRLPRGDISANPAI